MTTPDIPAPEPTGSDLGVFGGASAEQVKEHVAAQRAELTRQSLAVEKRLRAAKAEMEAKRAKMEAEFRRAQAAMPPVATVGALITRLSALDANTPVAVTNGQYLRVMPSVLDGSVVRNARGDTVAVSSVSDSLESDVWIAHDLPKDAARVVVID